MFKDLHEKLKKLLFGKGKQAVEEIGDEVIADLVEGVLLGKNVRDSTELLTRAKLNALYAATVSAFVGELERLQAQEIIKNAASLLLEKPTKEEKIVYLWLLGLTGKGLQNVLRDDKTKIAQYSAEYSELLSDGAKEFRDEYGELSGQIELGGKRMKVTWESFILLATILGGQTLSARGSDKSKFGKLFERLVLGSVLRILGFEMREPGTAGTNIFWLSERLDNKREADGTVLFGDNLMVRFDIGFIGRGNTEISLDKVSRYEREVEINGEKKFASTVVIVDRIGSKSRITEMAKNINGVILQMADSKWLIRLAESFKELGYKSEILEAEDLEKFVEQRLKQIDFKDLLP